MFIIKALGRLCLLPFKLIWFILKTLVYICTLFQYDPWKRAPLQQLKDLNFQSIHFNTRVRLTNKKLVKASMKDAKLVYKFIRKHSKWPRWLDKEFGENRASLGFSQPKTKGHFVAECKRRVALFGMALQHHYELVCTDKDIAKLNKKLKTTELDVERKDQTANVLSSFGASFYNACAQEGVLLTRVDCNCGGMPSLNQDFTTDCCPETLKYSKKGQKGIIKAMVSVLKKKEAVRRRVEVEGGEAPEGYDRSDDDEDDLCTTCGEDEEDCECEKPSS